MGGGASRSAEEAGEEAEEPEQRRERKRERERERKAKQGREPQEPWEGKILLTDSESLKSTQGMVTSPKSARPGELRVAGQGASMRRAREEKKDDERGMMDVQLQLKIGHAPRSKLVS